METFVLRHSPQQIYVARLPVARRAKRASGGRGKERPSTRRGGASGKEMEGVAHKILHAAVREAGFFLKATDFLVW